MKRTLRTRRRNGGGRRKGKGGGTKRKRTDSSWNSGVKHKIRRLNTRSSKSSKKSSSGKKSSSNKSSSKKSSSGSRMATSSSGMKEIDKKYPIHPPPSKSAILIRYLSEEDRLSVMREKRNSEPNEPISGVFHSGLQTVTLDFWKLNYDFLDSMLLGTVKSLLKQYAQKQYKMILSEVKSAPKSKKKTLMNEYINKFLSKIKKRVSLEIEVDIHLCYYPLNCRGLMYPDITIHEYLGNKAFSGTRKGHGIHGFFTMNKGKDNSDYNYGDYGLWGIGEGGGRRATEKEVTSGAKNIFVSYYGDKEPRTFEELFQTKGSVRYVDCSKGVGTGAVPTAVEDAEVKLATCPEFEKKCLEDGILYSRLGALMGGFERGEEINIRGTGKIAGCVIDMHSLSSKEDKVIPRNNKGKDSLFTKELCDTIGKGLAKDINTQLKKEVDKNMYMFYRDIFLHIEEGLYSGKSK